MRARAPAGTHQPGGLRPRLRGTRGPGPRAAGARHFELFGARNRTSRAAALFPVAMYARPSSRQASPVLCGKIPSSSLQRSSKRPIAVGASPASKVQCARFSFNR